jgi:hypothetical protein
VERELQVHDDAIILNRVISRISIDKGPRLRNLVVASLVACGIGCLTILAGCSQSQAPAPSPPSTIAVPLSSPQMGSQVVAQIGLGQLSGHTYSHDHFKLAVTIPEEWYIQNRTESDQLTQLGASMMKPDAKNGQAVVQAAQQRTLTLLSAFRYPPGTPDLVNSSFIIVAENVAFFPGLTKGEDFLKLSQRSMGSMNLKYAFEPIETGFQIGSHPAARLRSHLQVLDYNVEQEMYAARLGDYFLMVILSYGKDEDPDAVRSILELLKAD